MLVDTRAHMFDGCSRVRVHECMCACVRACSHAYALAAEGYMSQQLSAVYEGPAT